MVHKYKILFVITQLLIGTAYASVSNGPYTGIEVGLSDQKMNFNSGTFNSTNTMNTTLDSTNWTFIGRLNLGYNVDKYTGFELGYSYNSLAGYAYPNNSGSLNGTVSTLDASYLLYLPTTIQKLSVFGRVGLAYDWINGNQADALNPSGSGFADLLGAGVKYNINPKTSFRFEWLENGVLNPIGVNGGSTPVANFSQQTFLLGLNYHF